jgi:predicted Zn-dependent peptidase
MCWAVVQDRRFLDPCPEEVAALTLEHARQAVQAQLGMDNLEVTIVGDIAGVDLDTYLLQYLGTVDAQSPPQTAEHALRLNLTVPAWDERRKQRLHLQDSDERACAYLAGPAPNRWAELPVAAMPATLTAAAKEAAAARRAHPLYAWVALTLMMEIVNSRLFTTVRDSLGLTYDVSFELSMFERLSTGWCVVVAPACRQLPSA